MTRKKFLRLLRLSIPGIVLSDIRLKNILGESLKIKKSKNWIWMHPWHDISEDEYKKRFDRIKSLGFDAILPNIYAGNQALYESEHLPVNSRLLEKILPNARSAGLEVHAWMWSMICNNEQIIKKHPDWFAVNRNGESTIDHPAYVGYYRFMCPNHPGVREFVKEIVSELAAYPDLDGIHLDYIRYPDVILPVKLQDQYGITQDKEYPAYDYCYCPRCCKLFKEKSGIDIMSEKKPEANTEWHQFRYDSITGIVNNHLIPPARKAGKYVSAAVFPNWVNVRQQWSKWDLDGVFPMLYHGFYNEDVEWIKTKIAEGRKLLDQKVELYSGLFVGFFTPDELTEAMDQSLVAGANGTALFEFNSLEEEFRTRIEQWTNQPGK